MREEISLIERLDRGLERQNRLEKQLVRLEVALGIESNDQDITKEDTV